MFWYTFAISIDLELVFQLRVGSMCVGTPQMKTGDLGVGNIAKTGIKQTKQTKKQSNM